MKHRDHFLTILKASEASMDPNFTAKLREKFAQQIVEPNVSVLSIFIQSMKQHSFIYGGFLSLIALSVYIIIPKGLSPQDILAKAADNYESTEGIYHEKVLHESFENGESVERAMDEVWYDSVGNFLQLTENPDTEEILTASMTTVSEFGDITDYSNDPAVIAQNPEISPERQDWLDTFAGEKIYCYQVAQIENGEGKSVLTLAADDYNIYTVTGEWLSTDEDSTDGADIYNISKNADTAESQLRSIIASGDYSYKEVEEAGQKYYTFSQAIAPYDEQEGEGGRIETYYFDVNTYQMTKQVMSFKYDDTQTKVDTFLVSEYIPAENANEIFNPTNYNNMIASPMLGTEMMPYSDQVHEDGCYNYAGQKLSDEETENILNAVPSITIDYWGSTLESIKQDMSGRVQEEIIYEAHEEPSEVELSPVGSKTSEFLLLFPTVGNITQSFLAGHYAIDIANRSKPEITAAADGTIIYVSPTGSYDGGYGNNVWIDHGNGYKTHYAHMETVDVKVGDAVTAGQVIGQMGNTGRVYGATGIQLHFELTKDDVKVNPLEYIDASNT